MLKSKYFIKLDLDDVSRFLKATSRMDASTNLIGLPGFNNYVLYSIDLLHDEATLLKLSVPNASFVNYSKQWINPEEIT